MTEHPGQTEVIICLRIPRIPPRDAFPRAFEGRHWSSRSGIKAEMKQEIGLEARNQLGYRPNVKPLAYAHIAWTFRSPRGNYDGDNVLAACKGWLDGLVEIGVIEDDTISRVSHTVRWERAKGEETVIEIREVIPKPLEIANADAARPV